MKRVGLVEFYGSRNLLQGGTKDWLRSASGFGLLPLVLMESSGFSVITSGTGRVRSAVEPELRLWCYRLPCRLAIALAFNSTEYRPLTGAESEPWEGDKVFQG